MVTPQDLALLHRMQPFGDPLHQRLNTAQNPLAKLGNNIPSVQAKPIQGVGGGLSDLVPAMGPNGPARLAEGEFVWPADVVGFIGNGSTEAGGRILKKAMEQIRKDMKKGGHKQTGAFHEVFGKKK